MDLALQVARVLRAVRRLPLAAARHLPRRRPVTARRVPRHQPLPQHLLLRRDVFLIVGSFVSVLNVSVGLANVPSSEATNFFMLLHST